MNEEIRAMLVHDQDSPVGGLKLMLEHQGIRTLRARNCEQAQMRLQNGELPQLVFTDTNLPDGKWADALELASKQPGPHRTWSVTSGGTVLA